jgi:hypothetical protein
MLRGMLVLLLSLACQTTNEPIPLDTDIDDTDVDTDIVGDDDDDSDPKSAWTWAWENPLPHGNDLDAVWGAGADQVFAVGNNAVAMTWDGVDWSTGELPLSEDYEDGHYTLWGWAGDDLAVGTAPGVVMWDPVADRAHAVQTSPDFAKVVWGFDNRDIWAVGGGVFSKTYRYEGTSWSEASDFPTMSNVTAMFGTANDDVMAVGWTAEFSTFDGSAWTLHTAGSDNFHGTWGADGKYWLVGERGRIYGWDGDAAERYEIDTKRDLYAVWGVSATDVWAVGESGVAVHWNGSAWSVHSTGVSRDLRGVWAAASDDVWAVGDDGVITHFDGSDWSFWSEGEYGDFWDLDEVDGVTWAVGDVTLRNDGGAWVDAEAPFAATGLATDDTELWLVGHGRAAKSSGSTWAEVTVPWQVQNGADGRFAVGEAIYELVDGTWVNVQEVSEELLTVSANGTRAAAGGREVYAHDGSTWTKLSFPWSEDPPVEAIYAFEDGSIWAGGSRGLYSYENSGWTRISDQSGAPQYDVVAIGGTTAEDMYVVVSSGFAFHWNGQEWDIVREMELDGQSAVLVNNDSVLTAGANGALLRFSAD